MIGEYVILKRKELGIERKDLAENLDISYNYLCQIETNKRKISSKKIKDFARELQVNEDEIKEHNEISKGNLGKEKRLAEKQILNINKQIATLETQIVILEKEREFYCEKIALLNKIKENESEGIIDE